MIIITIPEEHKKNAFHIEEYLKHKAKITPNEKMTVITIPTEVTAQA